MDHQHPQLPSAEELAPHFEKLEIGECITADGIQSVYLATQTNLDRKVTLKIVPIDWGNEEDAGLEKFTAQARLMAKLTQRNIVGLHDFGTIPALKIAYFLMEYGEGETLAKKIAKNPIPPSEIHSLMKRICAGLDHAHREGVWHLNLKPSNIIVAPDGGLKIIDFGLVQLSQGVGSSGLVGTPAYAAPEMCGKNPRPDHRSDIYSLGITLYALLTGAPPTDTFPPPSEVVEGCPKEIDQLIVRCIEEDPFDRFQSAKEIPAAIAAAFDSSSYANAPGAAAAPEKAVGPKTIKTAQRPAKVEVSRAATSAPAVDEERLARAAAQGKRLNRQAKVKSIALWFAVIFIAAVLAPFLYAMGKRKMASPGSSSDNLVVTQGATAEGSPPSVATGESEELVQVDTSVPEGMIPIISSTGATLPEGTTISDWLAGAAWEAHAMLTIPPGKDLQAGNAQPVFEFGDRSRGVGLYLTLEGDTVALSVVGDVKGGENFQVPLAIKEGKTVTAIVRSEPNPTGTGTIITVDIDPGGQEVAEFEEVSWVGGNGPDGFGSSAGSTKELAGGIAQLKEIKSLTPYGGEVSFALYAEPASE